MGAQAHRVFTTSPRSSLRPARTNPRGQTPAMPTALEERSWRGACGSHSLRPRAAATRLAVASPPLDRLNVGGRGSGRAWHSPLRRRAHAAVLGALRLLALGGARGRSGRVLVFLGQIISCGEVVCVRMYVYVCECACACVRACECTHVRANASAQAGVHPPTAAALLGVAGYAPPAPTSAAPATDLQEGVRPGMEGCSSTRWRPGQRAISLPSPPSPPLPTPTVDQPHLTPA
jgi:hypothetical protein